MTHKTDRGGMRYSVLDIITDNIIVTFTTTDVTFLPLSKQTSNTRRGEDLPQLHAAIK